MVSNRKARRLLGVPSSKVGVILAFNISNRATLYRVGDDEAVGSKPSRQQKRVGVEID